MAATDRDALEALFRSTGGDTWEKSANWTTDAELSTWEGLRVDEDGRVVGLTLIINSLKGTSNLLLRTHFALLPCALSSTISGQSIARDL